MNEAVPAPHFSFLHPFAFLFTHTHIVMRCSHSGAQRGAAHTHSDMARRAERCVMISVCLLLLPPLCWGVEFDHEYENESTDIPEFDYNSTFEYSFFSNVSSDVLEKFLNGEEFNPGGETSFTESETDGRMHQEKPTEPPVMFESQASRSSPACLLLTLVVMVHHLLRLL